MDCPQPRRRRPEPCGMGRLKYRLTYRIGQYSTSRTVGLAGTTAPNPIGRFMTDACTTKPISLLAHSRHEVLCFNRPVRCAGDGHETTGIYILVGSAAVAW